MTFNITVQENTRLTTPAKMRFTIEADNYSEAATKAARKIYRRKTVTAMRTTGEHSKSGWFNAYEPCKNGGMSSIGDPFHITD